MHVILENENTTEKLYRILAEQIRSRRSVKTVELKESEIVELEESSHFEYKSPVLAVSFSKEYLWNINPNDNFSELYETYKYKVRVISENWDN